MIFLKADTAVEVLVGPAVAVGDGFTPVTNLVGASADEYELIKYNGATALTAAAPTNALAAITGADGYYSLELATGDVDTEGPLWLIINDDSLILPIRHEFMVVNANVYDSLFAAAATDTLDVQVTGIGASVITATSIATDAIAGAKIATDAVTKIRSIVNGTADAGGTTTTLVDAALTEIDDTWNGCWLLLTSGTDANRVRLITDFNAATDTITFAPAVSASIGAGVTYEILPAGGVDVQSWIATESAHQAPNALVAGAVDADVSAIQSGAITAAAIGTGAIDADAIATDAITNAKIAADAIGSSELATDAIGSAQLATTGVNKIRDAILPPINTAYNDIKFFMALTSDHVSAATGLSLTVTRSIDGGSFGSGTGTAAEIGNGIYQYDASAADMNGTNIVFRFEGTAADDTFVLVRTGG